MAIAIADFSGRYRRYSEASAANTAMTTTTPTGVACRVLYSTVAYSAAPTQAGVTHILDSGVDAAYDATISTGTANAQYTVFQPTADFALAGTDAFKVTAPAGGAGITAAIVIVVELL